MEQVLAATAAARGAAAWVTARLMQQPGMVILKRPLQSLAGLKPVQLSAATAAVMPPPAALTQHPAGKGRGARGGAPS